MTVGLGQSIDHGKGITPNHVDAIWGNLFLNDRPKGTRRRLVLFHTVLR